MREILGCAGNLLQVFIITSHPERYRGMVPDDYQFDLAAISAEAQRAYGA